MFSLLCKVSFCELCILIVMSSSVYLSCFFLSLVSERKNYEKPWCMSCLGRWGCRIKERKKGDTFTHGWYFRPSLWTVAPMDEGTILVYCCPSTFSLTYPPPPPLPKLNVQYIKRVCGCWGVVPGRVFCRSFTLCFLTDSELTKIASPPQTKMTSADDDI